MGDFSESQASLAKWQFPMICTSQAAVRIRGSNEREFFPENQAHGVCSRLVTTVTFFAKVSISKVSRLVGASVGFPRISHGQLNNNLHTSIPKSPAFASGQSQI